MRHIPSRRSLFLGGKNYVWSGQTWLLNSSGRLNNIPTLGSELLTDGGFENWSSPTNLTSWSETTAGTSTINRESSAPQSGTYAARLDIDGSNSAATISQTLTLATGTWYVISYYVKTSNGAVSVRVDFGGVSGTAIVPTTSYTQRNFVQRHTGAAGRIDLGRNSAASQSIFYDDVTCKLLSLSTLFATIVGFAGQTVSAKPYSIITGTQTGVIYGLDSVTNPQNLILAYHDGTGVILDKLISGVWTNVIARVSVAFSADSEIKIQPLGSDQYDMYYGGVKRGSTATISGITGTNHGLFSTYNGNIFTDFSLDGKIIPFKF